MLNSRRHKTVVAKNFEDMSFPEQRRAMNRNALQFRRQLMIHLHRAKSEGHCTKTVLNSRIRLLGRLFDKHASEIETSAV
jgi:hypothetical protein